MMKRYLTIALSVLMLTLTLSACTTSPTLPETDAPTGTSTDVPTASPTEPATEPPESDSETVPDTEPSATEPVETEPLFDPNDPGSPVTIVFDGENDLSFAQATGCQTELYLDEEKGHVLKITPTTPKNYIVFEYERYMQAQGLTPINLEDYRFALVTVKTGAAYGSAHTSSLMNFGCAAGSVEEYKIANSVEMSYTPKATEWQTVLVDLQAKEWNGTLHGLLLSATYKTRADEFYCIASISFVDSATMDMLETPLYTEVPVKGLSEPFTVLHITDLHASDFTQAELSVMSAARQADVQGRQAAFWGNYPFRPSDVLTAVDRYVTDTDVDLILATGDMIDFPSEANMALLTNFVQNSSKPVFYMAGNHDWTYSDDYMTSNAIATYLPPISALAGAQNGVGVYETESIVFVSIDNSSDTVTAAAVEAYFAAVTDARAKGKAVVLALHVPFTAETLVADCKRVWNRNICIGPGGISDWHEPTMNLYRAVTEGTELAPDAVISGHMHFSHEDVFPNGVTQIITADASGDGLCRIIRFVPA